MKKGLIILSLLLLIFGCKDDRPAIPKEEILLPFYVKNMLSPDTISPYKGNYYIDVIFINNATAEKKQMTFDENNASMAIRYDSSSGTAGLSEYTVLFIGSPLREQLEVSFYYDLATDTVFHVYYANYYYGDIWKGMAGVNVVYYKPSGANNGSTRYIYQGIESENSYFRVTYHGNGRVNGTFRSTWKERGGEETIYKVRGEFSIPYLDITKSS